MADIKFNNISKIYDKDVKAVEDFNLYIKDKEFVIFVGPSGCGKSTTLRMIAGLEDITGGELYIGDKLVNNVSPKDRDIAMVFQTYALYPHKSVYKNMSFALELQKLPKDEIDRRVREAAKALDIEKYLDRKPKALSGGQRQRVALGRAMVRQPSVFLLDEPLSNLDAKLRSSMRAEIKRLHNRLGTTFVYVTHDQTEAMTMGDRIVVMNAGKIMQTDTPSNLYNRPCNLFVAGFIGLPQMNFLRGTVRRGKKTSLELSGDMIDLPDDECPSQIAKYIDNEVIVGIRPEDIDEEKKELFKNTAVITAAVEVTEFLGNESYLHLNYCGSDITARISADAEVNEGESVRLTLNTAKLHFFDAKTQERIV